MGRVDGPWHASTYMLELLPSMCWVPLQPHQKCKGNRDRAPSGPVKVVVTNQPHSRPNAGIDVVSGVSALLAWFPASWASKVAECFIGDAGGATQLPQEVTIQCPNREAAGTQRDEGDQMLQAIKFTDKRVPGLHLDLDEDFQTAGCCMEVIRGYKMGVVEPNVMRGLQPAGATRVTLDVTVSSLLLQA